MLKTSPLFKGATRPACIFGIPMTPFVLIVGVFTLSAFLWVPLLLFLPVVLYVLRKMAEKDDQFFHQAVLNLRLNVAQNMNRRFWGGVTSVSSRQKGIPILENRIDNK